RGRPPHSPDGRRGRCREGAGRACLSRGRLHGRRRRLELPLRRGVGVRKPMKIRDATDADAAAIQAIYAHHVLHGRASYEEVPPDVAEMRSRMQAVRSHGLAYLVAEEAGEVLGYSYASLYRTRSAYRHTIENSVYVREGSGRRGIGGALLVALIERCEG